MDDADKYKHVGLIQALEALNAHVERRWNERAKAEIMAPGKAATSSEGVFRRFYDAFWRRR